MRTEVARALWRPVGVEDLEPAADAAVRAGENTLVVAGPGSGKTELLGQRACFLLQTGTCADPRRILAISFKRDAARNLRDRVQRRCGRDLAHRFDSYTFDSFSKGLVDRFLAALPQPFRPAADYRVLVGKDFNERRMMDLVRHMPSDLSAMALNSLNGDAVWRAFLGRSLPVDGEWENRSVEERAAAKLWRHMLQDGGSAISFPMLGRLAELLLRSNPQVLAAMRKSYGYLFLDEFQDTTGIHYELVCTAFQDSSTVVTAVGDDKQRIMGWAGAMKHVFRQFENDFGATRVPLERNYRSAPRLVKIQSVVAKALDPKAVEAVAMDDGEDGDGECEVLTFEDDREEAKHLAGQIANWISDDGLRPRDICVLCRMKRDWSEALDELEGVDSVPIMTTHKSKGLEYHTIIFVGLEDGAHFNFSANAAEETCGFFVALSRAMKRVIFTYDGKRPTAKSRLYVVQDREELAPLYDLLKKAGVHVPED